MKHTVLFSNQLEVDEFLCRVLPASKLLKLLQTDGVSELYLATYGLVKLTTIKKNGGFEVTIET